MKQNATMEEQYIDLIVLPPVCCEIGKGSLAAAKLPGWECSVGATKAVEVGAPVGIVEVGISDGIAAVNHHAVADI